MTAMPRLLGSALATLAMGACALGGPTRDDTIGCSAPLEASPPSAATPTGPTAMSPPLGYPPMMNPTAPMTVASAPSNMGYGGARTPPTEANLARERCAQSAAGRIGS